ncbi:Serine/threonine-protein kinase PK-1 [Enhygromyxa salina]|uniref:Serine/threonine-protein kinase PK-1 n=1 Tax=Enhygromyxa salina TaxID=215803 RepID=A0A2S9YJT5_9BACT|nr:protein kinase [Enhygromyxa salina]PRQ05286.1 Serine/threonine-protein kinase PK-1 [Enhygromyxa salina]
MDEGTLDGTDDSGGLSIDAGQPASGLETLLSTGASSAEVRLDEDPVHIARFVVLRRVGQGGMGVVYAAYDNELDRRLAIKLVHLARARADTRARVRREAQAMARLSHPNVVQVYEVGEHEGQVFVAMEFVTGPTLAEWARELEPGPGRWRAIVDKYVDVGRGLAAAHDAHIVHRDFKPANAIVGDDGRVRVLDFGIARAPAEAAAARDAPAPVEPKATDDPRPDGPSDRGGLDDPMSTPLTMTGALVGTPAYMSPEQFQRGAVDARSDQFSFCVALYEALYRERPFSGDTPATLMCAVLSGDTRPPPAHAEVPGWVREIVMRGLEVDPDARWPSMAALLDALGRDPARRRRRRLQLLASTSLVVAAIAASGWYARGQMRSADLAEAARVEAQRAKAEAQAREARAEAARDQALLEAKASAVRARDTARVLAARGLDGEPDVAAALLRDVEHPAATPGWRSATVNALQHPLTEGVLRDHSDRITYLDAARSGAWFASSSFDGTARLWPREGGPATVLRHDDSVISVSFDSGSTRVVTASRDRTAAVWDLPAQPGDPAPEPLVLRGHTDMLWSAQFSLDGTRVVTASRDGTVRVWPLDRPDEAPIVWEQGQHIIWWAEFSADGRFVVSAGSDGTVAVWSVDEPERPPVLLEGHTASVGDVHFIDQLGVIATASADGSARLFRFERDDPGPVQAYAVLNHDADVFRIRPSILGLTLVTASRDRTAKAWTLDEAGELRGPPQVFASDEGVVWSPELSPDGRLLALGLGGGDVQVQTLDGGPPLSLTGHTSDVFRVRFSSDGRQLYSGSYDGTVRVWSTDWHTTGRLLRGHRDHVTVIEQRGQVLVSGAHDGTVRVWPVLDPGPTMAVTAGPAVLDGHRGRVALSLDDHPRLLASADETPNHVRLWRISGTWVLDPQRPLATLRTDGEIPSALDLDGAGQLLAAGSSDGAVLLWQLGSDPARASPDPLRLGHHQSGATAFTPVQFSPDQTKLASGGRDGIVNVWDRAALLSAEAGQEPPAPTVLAGHTSRVYSLRFSPDSRLLVSAGTDDTARVWNLAEPDAEPLALDHGYFVNASSFDPSGRWLATACSDTNAYLWDLDDPRTPTLLTGASGEIRDVEFSPDGRWIGAVSFDGSLRIWPREGGEAIELDAGFPLSALAFVDEGRRVAVGGLGADLPLWYLGTDLDVDSLRERLAHESTLCLSPEQRMQLVGQSPEAATAASSACHNLSLSTP